MSDTWVSILVGAGVIICIMLCFICHNVRDSVFERGGDWITGLLWGTSVVTLIALFVPAAREFLEVQIAEITDISSFRFPRQGSAWFWGVLACGAIIVGSFWFYWRHYSGSFLLKTIWMLIFCAVYTIGTLMIVGIVMRLLALALVVAVVGCFCMAGKDGPVTPPKPEKKEEPVEKKTVEVWRYNGLVREGLKVSRDQTHYYDPDTEEWKRIE